MFIEELKKIDEVIISTECPECGGEEEYIVFSNFKEFEFQYNKGVICCENCKKAYRFKGNINYLKSFFLQEFKI